MNVVLEIAVRVSGLDHDGEAISQFARVDRHREVAEAMLAAGTAYRCFSTQEEIETFREAARYLARVQRDVKKRIPHATVVNNYQLKRLEETVYTLDPDAFMITENTFNVLGNGFSKRKVY